MEGHRLPFLADGSDDDSAFDSSRSVTQNHERSRNQERNGKFTIAQARRRHARYERDDVKVLRWWNASTKAKCSKWLQSQKEELN